MNMYPEAEQFLLQGNYQELIAFYEQKIENDPDNIDNYWYLGLAYLLQGQEEEAQLTWFMVFEQLSEPEINHQTQILAKILSQEADRQLTLNNHQLAWVIRGHLRELAPDDLANFLELICLDIYLHNSDIERFETWNLGEYCQGFSSDDLATELLLKTLNIILCLPCPDSLAFARFSLKKSQDFELIFATVFNLAIKIAYDYDYIDYAVDLLKITLEFEPENLTLLNAIYVFYSHPKNHKRAKEIAYQFKEHSTTTLNTEIFANFQLIKTCLHSHEWSELLDLFRQQKILFQKYLNNPEISQIDFIRNSWILITQPLFYLQDNPQENRYFLNNFSKIFQSSFRQDSPIAIKPYTNLLTNDRPLKIGYLGNTFKAHSVGWLCRWLIQHHNQEQYPSYIYFLNKKSDEITEKFFKEQVQRFYHCNRNIAKTIEQIQEDQIDILVDLDSLTLDSTCHILALKPAPIQVTWLGMDATGLPTVDYFIADPYVLPENAQEYYSEKIWRLPQTYLGIDGFEVSVPTLTREDLEIDSDAIIFLNVQTQQKLHPDTIRLQMRILKEVENSYLLIKGRNQLKIVTHFFEHLAEEEGIDLNRLRFLEGTATELEHRANLTIADVVLDTYPYNGATTTLETLWMEIPLVTRVGEQFAARNSYTFMMNAGITEGIAWTDEEYIDWGIRLGKDENLRKEISWKLRQSKQTSPLWNAKQFTLEMEKAYRQMWEIYLKENQ